MKKELDDSYNDLSYAVIGAAMEVHRTLGPGLLENVYEEALCVELTLREIAHERQKVVGIDYKGHAIGDLRADVIVEERIILELKAVERLLPVHQAQLMTYLKVMKLPLGLLINFNIPVLKNGIKRVIL